MAPAVCGQGLNFQPVAFWSASSHLLGVLTAGKGKGVVGVGAAEVLALFCFPSPHFKQAASALNNHTVLEYGTLSKSRFVVAQPARRLLQKWGILGSHTRKGKREWTFTTFFFWFSGALQIKTRYNTFKRKMSLAQSQVLENSWCAVQYVCMFISESFHCLIFFHETRIHTKLSVVWHKVNVC